MRTVVLLGLALAGAMAVGHAKERQMTVGERTHCLGRFLLDLPADAQVRASYTFADAKVTTQQGVSAEQFGRSVAAREAELGRAAHGDGGSMLVERTELAPGKEAIVSWASPASRLMYRHDSFAHFPQEQLLFGFESEGDATDHARARAYEYRQSLFAESLRPRQDDEIPAEAGFCIDSGFIGRSRLNREEVTANIRLRQYPSVTLTFMSYVTANPDRELLRRTSTIPPGYEEVAARMQTLRRGSRDLGRIQGQELLVRGDGEGKKAYEFLWESQGRASSLEFPFLSLQLSTTGESDAQGEVIDAPFESDEEAMAFWDSILGSLRLRPGAVAR